MFITPDAMQKTLIENTRKAFDFNKEVVDWQTNQLKAADAQMRKQATNSMDLTMKTWTDSAQALLDLQNKALSAMTPAKAEA